MDTAEAARANRHQYNEPSKETRDDVDAFRPAPGMGPVDRKAFRGTRAMQMMPMEAYRRRDEFHVALDLPWVNPDVI